MFWSRAPLPRLLRLALLGGLLFCATHWALAQTLQPVPALTARVVDLSATLTPDQRMQLENQLAAFEQAQGSQIVILLVPTTQPEDISAYANRVFNTWRPGRAGVGDGLLIVVARQDRQIRIEVARALEGAVPDLAAKQVIDDVLAPHFRQGDFATGLTQAVERLTALIRGESLPAPAHPAPATSRDDGVDWMDLGLLLLIAVPVLGSLARRILGHKLGTLATGGLTAALTLAFTSSLLLAWVAALLAMLLTFIASTPWGSALLAASQQHRGGGWGGGGLGSGGGFSSGGGGDFGGGGASGDW